MSALSLPMKGQRDAARPALAELSRAERSRSQDLFAQAGAALKRSCALIEASRRIIDSAGKPVPLSRELLARCAYARLMAQVASMPVIEQAKGVLMAQTGCGDDEAFDMLRRASQRLNMPVRDLAAQIVARTAQSRSGSAKAS